MNDKMDSNRCSLEKMFTDKPEDLGSSLERQLNGKIDSLRDSVVELVKESKDDMKAELQRKSKEIQDNMDLEIGHLRAQIDQMEMNKNVTRARHFQFNSDVSIIVSGLPFEEGECERKRRRAAGCWSAV